MTGPDDSIVSSDELSDGTESTSFEVVAIDATVVTNPIVLGAAGGAVVGLGILMWPDRTDRTVGVLVGVGLLWWAVVGLRAGLRPGRLGRLGWTSIATAVVALVVGAFLLAYPQWTTVTVGRVIGGLAVAHAARSILPVIRGRSRDWARVLFAGMEVTVGLVLITLSGELLSTAISVAALLLVSVCVLVLVVSLDARTEGVADYQGTSDLVMAWLRERPKSVDARQALYDKILYEGPATRTRIIRFFTLMGFASVIASMGVISDSTAVVIGAMLVAPLMTPLMGMAISLVMGWPNRLARASSMAFGGIVFAITIGLLLGLTVPSAIDTAANTQILARTSPTMLDLITAIAAGGAGAYGLSRPDVSDSLPGVAIAISLVPPLTVVGIAFSQGDWAWGFGALLLFATNMVAILIVGGIMFVLTGVTPIDHASSNADRVRTAVGATLTGAVIVLAALLLNGAQIAADALQQSTVEEVVEDWLPEDGRYRLFEARIQGDQVSTIVVGPSEGLPAVDDLADRLSDQLDKPVTVEVSLVVEERLTATSDGS
ncbi:MAG: DUF389 domain-containing protein [Actinomycetota bacterium]